MNFKPNPDNTTWAHATISTTVTEARADIIYDIGRPVHRKGILEVLAQAFVQEPSTAYQIHRPTQLRSLAEVHRILHRRLHH
jgi:hypothetical protein